MRVKIHARVLAMIERIILCTVDQFTELYTSKLCNKEGITGAKGGHLKELI